MQNTFEIKNIWVATDAGPEYDWAKCEIITNEKGEVQDLKINSDTVTDRTQSLRVIDTNQIPASCYWLQISENKLYKITYDKGGVIQRSCILSGLWKEKKRLQGPEYRRLYNENTYKQITDATSIVIELQQKAFCPLNLDILSEFNPNPEVRSPDPVYRERLADEDTAERKRTSFITALIKKYEEKVYSELYELCGEHQSDLSSDDFTEKLINYLKLNWELVQGNPICYTAIPQHPVTRLLIKIAENLAYKTGSQALEILMPGINPEPLSDKFPDLYLLSLQKIVDTHVLGEKHSYLIPISCLLRENFNDKVFNFYCPYEYKETNSYLTESECKRLITHSTLTRELVDCQRTYIEISRNESTLFGQLNILRDLLKKYDAHSGIGSQETAGRGADMAILNFMAYYTDLQRCGLSIIEHIPPTLADLPENENKGYIVDYDLSDPEKKELYFFNKSHKGKEIKPLKLVDPSKASIFDKLTQTNKLNDEQIYSIYDATKHHMITENAIVPQSTHDEIIKLWEFTHDTTTIGNIASCIGTRGERLEETIRENEDILKDIAIDKESQRILLENCERNLEIATDRINTAIENQVYTGKDELNITSNLLKVFGIEFKLDTPEQLKLLQAMQPEDIRELLVDKTRQTNLLEQLDTADKLYEFIIDTPALTLQSILEYINHELLKKFKWIDIVSVLNALTPTPEKLNLVCRALKEPISQSNSQATLTPILEQMSEEVIATICQEWKDYLSEIFKLEELRVMPMPKNFSVICHNLKLIKSIDDAIIIIIIIMIMRKFDIKGFKDLLLPFIQSPRDVGCILNKIAGKRFPFWDINSLFSELFRWNDPIKSLNDLSEFLSSLTKDTLKNMFDYYPFISKLRLIKSSEDLGNLLKHFPSTAYLDINTTLEFNRFIKSTNDLANVLNSIPNSSYESFYKLFKLNFSFKSCDLLKSIKHERILEVYEFFSNIYSSFRIELAGVVELINHVSLETQKIGITLISTLPKFQYTTLLNTINIDKLDSVWIYLNSKHSASELVRIFTFLNDDRIRHLCTHFPEDYKKFVTQASNNNDHKALAKISKQIDEPLSEIIDDNILCERLNFMSNEECIFACTKWKDYLSEKFQLSNFKSYSTKLDYRKLSIIDRQLKLIKSAENVVYLINNYYIRSLIDFTENFKPFLKSPDDLGYILLNLKSLPNYITHYEQFISCIDSVHFLNNLNLFIADKAEKYLFDTVYSKFVGCINNLSIYEIITACYKMKDRLSETQLINLKKLTFIRLTGGSLSSVNLNAFCKKLELIKSVDDVVICIRMDINNLDVLKDNFINFLSSPDSFGEILAKLGAIDISSLESLSFAAGLLESDIYQKLASYRDPIQSINDLCVFLNKFSEDQLRNILKSGKFKQKLRDLVKSKDDIHILLNKIPFNLYKLLDGLMIWSRSLIKDFYDFFINIKREKVFDIYMGFQTYTYNRQFTLSPVQLADLINYFYGNNYPDDVCDKFINLITYNSFISFLHQINVSYLPNVWKKLNTKFGLDNLITGLTKVSDDRITKWLCENVNENYNLLEEKLLQNHNQNQTTNLNIIPESRLPDFCKSLHSIKVYELKCILVNPSSSRTKQILAYNALKDKIYIRELISEIKMNNIYIEMRLKEKFNRYLDLREVISKLEMNHTAIQMVLKEEFKEKLNRYIERIEQNKTTNQSPNFQFGFWAFKESRGINREINYLLAKTLLAELNKPGANANDILNQVNVYRKEIVDQKRQNGTSVSDWGIQSATLNSIINDMKTMASVGETSSSYKPK